MADELNIPTHRWYQPRNNISLPNSDFSKQWIYDSGIQKIDAWINGGTPAFSPADLFSTTAIGIWLDPSDLSTMFSDRAGTTPVTTPGTVVGLRLDKSKGLVLGSELVVNGDFSGGTTGWTVDSPVTLTVSGGQAAIARNSGTISQFPRQAIVTAGKWYRVTFTVIARSHNVQIYLQDTAAISTFIISATGTFTVLLLAGSADSLGLRIGPTGDFAATCTIDNISVRELAGNHAVAPTDAARPTYGVEPKGGRRNLLTWSEDFSNAVWAKILATATATKISSSATATQSFLQASQSLTKAASSLTYTFSVELKEAELRYIGVNIQDAAAANGIFTWTDTRDAANLNQGAFGAGFTFGSATRTLLGDGYVRVVVTGTTNTGTTISAVVLPSKNSTFSSASYVLGEGMLVRNAQLELGSTATAYQRVTNDYDVTEAGVQTCHYCRYDGFNTSMSTSAIDFTGTDKMSVFAGVRKSAGDGIMLELGPNVNDNAGSFAMYPGSYGVSFTDYAFISGGTNRRSIDYEAGVSVPYYGLMTGLGDISGDLNRLRVNGIQVAQTTADQGTGNFGNYSLFIGRRNNATLPFNGRDYGIVIVGKAASAGEITDTELWLSDKTAEVDVAKSISPNIYTRSGDMILDRANSIIERRTV